RGGVLRGQCRRRARDHDDVDAGADQLLDDSLRRLLARLDVPPLDGDVLALLPSVLSQAVDERLPPEVWHRRVDRLVRDIAAPRQLPRFLRTSRHWRAKSDQSDADRERAAPDHRGARRSRGATATIIETDKAAARAESRVGTARRRSPRSASED